MKYTACLSFQSQLRRQTSAESALSDIRESQLQFCPKEVPPGQQLSHCNESQCCVLCMGKVRWHYGGASMPAHRQEDAL